MENERAAEGGRGGGKPRKREPFTHMQTHAHTKSVVRLYFCMHVYILVLRSQWQQPIFNEMTAKNNKTVLLRFFYVAVKMDFSS